MTTTRSGLATVAAFGDDGWGTLQPHVRDGSPDPEPVAFHSTAIVDGSRTIEAGARVRYRIVPGRQGRWEATDVEPVGAG
ncbi:MAG: cold-shock protein [Acidimicrobiales bacterium]